MRVVVIGEGEGIMTRLVPTHHVDHEAARQAARIGGEARVGRRRELQPLCHVVADAWSLEHIDSARDSSYGAQGW